MAQLKGPILFTGSMGNIRAYYDKALKRYFVSTKGGSTKEQHDLGQKGYRSIESSRYSRLLPGFNFNKLHPFDQVFAHQYEVLFLDNKQTVTLKLLGFRSFSRINWPERFAAYRISLVIGQLPDWDWNTREERFQPVVASLEGTAKTVYSD